MKCALLALLTALTPIGDAFAEGGLGDLREASRLAGQRTSELRARRSALQRELDELAPQIESLKRDRGTLPSQNLNRRLRRSQELSTQLTELARSLADAEADAAGRNSKLLDGLSAELQRLEAAWNEGSSRERREALGAQLRALAAERDRLRGALTPQAVPAPQPAANSEEPEDLLRQVDLLRDAEDKAKRQLAAIEARIGELRQEEALDRRMREFSGQQSLFDEQDRRFRLTPSAPASALPVAGGSGAGRPGDTGPPSTSSAAARSAEKPPQPDPPRPSASVPADDLRLLESQRDSLEALARSLREQSQKLEERARGKGQP